MSGGRADGEERLGRCGCATSRARRRLTPSWPREIRADRRLGRTLAADERAAPDCWTRSAAAPRGRTGLRRSGRPARGGGGLGRAVRVGGERRTTRRPATPRRHPRRRGPRSRRSSALPPAARGRAGGLAAAAAALALWSAMPRRPRRRDARPARTAGDRRWRARCDRRRATSAPGAGGPRGDASPATRAAPACAWRDGSQVCLERGTGAAGAAGAEPRIALEAGKVAASGDPPAGRAGDLHHRHRRPRR